MKSFTVTYLVTVEKEEDPEQKLHNLCLEQSVELPDDVVPEELQESVVSKVTEMSSVADHTLRVTIAWPVDNLGGEVHQLINLLFGNISLQRGIKIIDLSWHDLAFMLPGPKFGIKKLRSLFNIPRRPLSATALKPLGSSPEKLGALCYEFACGGIDIIKDDHNLANQPHAPFKERVEACVQAIRRAAEETGRRSRYFANVTGDHSAIFKRVEIAKKAGVDGIMIAPHICGLPVLTEIRDADFDLPVITHIAFAGSLFADPNHGMSPGFLVGGLWRALGADLVIYPNMGGRFTFDESTCLAIAEQATDPKLPFKPAFPMPGGGIQRNNISKWAGMYGNDTVLLIGGSLYQHPRGIRYASREFYHKMEQLP